MIASVWIKRLGGVFAVTLLLEGCAFNPLHKNRDQATDMRGVLRAHLAARATRDPPARAQDAATDDLRRLPNPVLITWVHAHFSGGDGGVPIPGYATAFSMYERDHLALPGEWPPR